MQPLSGRISAFVKLVDACLAAFETPTTPPIESHPHFANLTLPKGFYVWKREAIKQARSIVRGLLRHEWMKDAVKTLLAFIRTLKTPGHIDHALWEQVRAVLEDATEYLRIDGDRPDSGKAEGNLNDRLREWLRSFPWDKDIHRPTRLQTAKHFGVSVNTVAGLSAWEEEMKERERRKHPSKARGKQSRCPKTRTRSLSMANYGSRADPRRDALQ